MHEAFTRAGAARVRERMNPMIEARHRGLGERRGERSSRSRAFKALTLDIAASIFVGVDLGPRDASA